jgi:hypothetical protein
MTLHDRVSGRTRLNRGFSQTYLSKQTEELFVHALLIMAEWGFGFEYRNLKIMVAKYLELNQLSHLFGQSGEPGYKWYKLFLKRWPTLSLRKAQNMPKSRAIASNPEVIDRFFTMLRSHYEKLSEIDPRDVYNCDEIGFNGIYECKMVITKRTAKNVYKLEGDGAKQMYTVLATCNAAGEYLGPHILYKAKNLYDTTLLFH